MSQITGEIVSKKLNSANKTTTHLDLSNGGYNSVCSGAFDRCLHLTSLDLSNNAFSTIEDELAKLINLKCLNLSGNSLRFPCKYFKKLPWLQELSIASNPMSKEQQTYAIYFIPSLIKLNGSAVDDTRSALTRHKNTLQSKIDLFWQSKKATCDEIKWKAYKMECLKKFKSRISAADKYKSLYSEQLDDLINEASAVWYENCVKQIQMNADADDANCLVKYAPQVFIRCHCADDNANDCTSEISSVIFIKDACSSSQSLLASAGANSICLIDPSSHEVVARYIHPFVNEEFTYLSYTVNSEEETIVAAATKSGCINLINISSLTCYFRWKSHNQCVTCLAFHPRKENLLFSSSLDKSIKMWSISDDELTKSSVVPLLTISVDFKVRTFIFSPEIDLIVAAGETGLFLATNIFQQAATTLPSTAKRSARGKRGNTTVTAAPADAVSSDISPSKSKRRKNRSLSSSLTFKCDENFNDKFACNLVCRHINYPNVDSLSILPSHPGYVAAKSCKEGNILIWSLGHLKNSLLTQGRGTTSASKSNQVPQFCVKIFFTFKFTPSNYGVCGQMASRNNLLACGDENGQVWIYAVDECLDNIDRDEDALDEKGPTAIVPWPSPDFSGDDNKSPLPDARVKCISISHDSGTLACATDVNLICISKMLH